MSSHLQHPPESDGRWLLKNLIYFRLPGRFFPGNSSRHASSFDWTRWIEPAVLEITSCIWISPFEYHCHLIWRGWGPILVVIWLDHFHPEVWEEYSELRITLLVNRIPPSRHGFSGKVLCKSRNLEGFGLNFIWLHSKWFIWLLMLQAMSAAWKCPYLNPPTLAWHP